MLLVDRSKWFANLGSILVFTVVELEVIVLLGACFDAHGSRRRFVVLAKEAVRLEVLAAASLDGNTGSVVGGGRARIVSDLQSSR